MKNLNRDLLVLVKDELTDEKRLEKEVGYLNDILLETECVERFCNVHELVNRNCITQKPGKILKAVKAKELKPFCFLINKN